MTEPEDLGELIYYLDLYRDIMLFKIEGLSEEQARFKPTPSANSLLTLIVHLTGVERWWFQEGIAGEPVDRTRDDEFVESATNVADAIAAYKQACERSNAIARSLPSISDRCKSERIANLSARAVMMHVLEETARHAGHADITRELIDGAVGFSRYSPD